MNAAPKPITQETDTDDLYEWCLCGHTRGEHLGTVTTYDDGPCNSRGDLYRNKPGKDGRKDRIIGPRMAASCDCMCYRKARESEGLIVTNSVFPEYIRLPNRSSVAV